MDPVPTQKEQRDGDQAPYLTGWGCPHSLHVDRQLGKHSSFSVLDLLNLSLLLKYWSSFFNK